MAAVTSNENALEDDPNVFCFTYMSTEILQLCIQFSVSVI